jgi:hypothetical protein
MNLNPYKHKNKIYKLNSHFSLKKIISPIIKISQQDKLIVCRPLPDSSDIQTLHT